MTSYDRVVDVSLAELAAGRVFEATATFAPPETEPLDTAGQGNAFAGFAFAAHRAVVEVDPALGLVRVVDLTTAADVGRVVNLPQLLGVLEGGTAVGVGIALLADLSSPWGGLTPGPPDVPLPTVAALMENAQAGAPYGVRGVWDVDGRPGGRGRARRRPGRDRRRRPLGARVPVGPGPGGIDAVSTHAAEHLPPAYPGRAPWGTAGKLRAWQEEALRDYLGRDARDYLAVATPGAGKTTFALRVAAELLNARKIAAVTIVAPTEHLKKQWADAAHRVGISVDPGFRNSDGAASRDFTGIAVTYAGVAAHPALHRNRTEARNTLVILDEVHHAGDARSWGEAVFEAFSPARRRLALTGTPFRSDLNPIPFVTYAPGSDGVLRSVADHVYGYEQALRDNVVRPVMFLAYSGQMRWRTRAGDELAATLGDPLTDDLSNQAWRTALDASGQWIPAVLSAADRRLTEVRRHIPDAGAMAIATDQNAARAYARRLTDLTGVAPTVVLSDDPGASARIERFSESPDDRWLVAVRMVSEGVDIPRLAVGVYATNTATPLFFAQAVGRFVRARRRGELASVFVPTVAPLLRHAAEMELQRDHVLGKPARADDDPFGPEDDLLAAAERANDGPDDGLGGEFQALESDATFDRVMFEGAEFGLQATPGSRDEENYLGLPGLLDPDQIQALLRKRQADQLRAAARRNSRAQKAGGEPAPVPVPADARPVATHKEVAALRRELHGLVGALHHRTGKSHGSIHSELRRACGGPATAQATVDDLRRRIAKVRQWASGPPGAGE